MNLFFFFILFYFIFKLYITVLVLLFFFSQKPMMFSLTQIIKMVWSLTKSQTFWSMMSSGP